MTFNIPKFHLRSGSGNGNPEDGLCLMQMVDWFDGRERKITDKPPCACPILTAYGIRLNDDAPSQDARDELWPLVFQLVGSRDKAAEKARIEFLIVETTRVCVADAFEAIGLHGHAKVLRSVQTVADVKRAAAAAADAAHAAAANAAANATTAAADAAAAAADAAHAAAADAAGAAANAAGAAAYAAYAAAYVAGAAANAAADAAHAAAAAAAAAGAAAAATTRLSMWRKAKDIFARAILMGRHGELDPVSVAPRAEKLAKVLEPVTP
jgi:hypothetical protein